MRLSTALLLAIGVYLAPTLPAFADSVNSPNITLNVDTNRSTGAGAGNVALTINTITIAETTLPEYSSGTNKKITITARPGYQFDTSSNVTAQSATIGFNGGGVNSVATIVPSGTANEVLTFSFTSGTASGTQDIIRINGIKLKILSAAGAVGPAQTTLSLTTSTAGGAFTNQGIVAANISRGAADRLVFANQPGTTQAGADLLPQVKIVDFGGNIVTSDARTISLAIETNPGSATLLGTAQRLSSNGLASWIDTDNLNITSAATGYKLQASHSGAAFLTSDTVNSGSFDITPGAPGGLIFSTQPSDTSAGNDIILDAAIVDEFSNPTTTNGVEITLDSAVNPGGWPLLVDTSLTKATVNGVASWGVSDHLRINKAITDYQLSASGFGAPVTSNSFDIVPGAASLLRFSVQPTSTTEDVAIDPAPSAEIIDSFGNRTASTATIDLTPSKTSCSGTVTGGSASAVSGVATYSSLVFDTPCENQKLNASSSGIAGAVSDSFSIKGIDAIPIEVKSSELKRRQHFKFSAKGPFTISKRAIDNPTSKGATLTVTGTTGKVKYTLPKGGWKKISAQGFQFIGTNCQSVVVKKNVISASCSGKTGSIKIPESQLDIVLALGKGTASFCGQCGGTTVGDASRLFKRKNCAAQTLCP